MTETPRRRGRPRKHPPRIDPGTPELQRHRALRAGGADPSLAEDPLALMAAKAMIEPWQAQAGRYYAWLYRKAVRWPHLSTNAHYEQLAMNAAPVPVESDEDFLALAHRLYLRGKRRLLREGATVARATENVAVFAQWPSFLEPQGPGRRAAMAHPAQGRRDAQQRSAIVLGLDALAQLYGMAERCR
ncbi:MAG TPA: hypothetical protein VHA10_01460 [Hypericibacter adhaerens]|uniref:hypothetical protein n=1 Tax=Hypericibacter adhaerens TaxID=2602016 RepID=UPI002B557952|nr:hypothetical protein [Hypericibacter adhaerens]HWA41848.1 hypothetical protein [Hypericibacter adhaerens]